MLGMIGRHSRAVVLEIARDKSKASAAAALTPHLPHDGVTIITDRAQYFRFLRERHHLHQVVKEKRHGAVAAQQARHQCTTRSEYDRGLLVAAVMP